MDIMKNCLSYRKLISRFVDNDLTDEEKQSLMDHFPSCMECMNVLNGYSMLRKYIRESYDSAVPEKTMMLPQQPDRLWSRLLTLFNPGIRLAAIGVAFVLVVVVGIFMRTELSGRSPIVIGNESSGMMNTPLGAMVYYEEFAGKTVSVQFAKLQNTTKDKELQNASAATTGVVGYESPLFHDNLLLRQRYDMLNGSDAF
jgi:hypothetical protein